MTGGGSLEQLGSHKIDRSGTIDLPAFSASSPWSHLFQTPPLVSLYIRRKNVVSSAVSGLTASHRQHGLGKIKEHHG
jgi:hypothetical protein